MEVKEIKKEVTITFDSEELKALKNICKVYLLCINSEVKTFDKVAYDIFNLEV